ncbi:tRNA pseudouridine(38/39) synthase [Maniola hyperantus]|uniref:tRNA pseudouridine(38/39) synthase n=1 Tax=Aphantopus hyperantus TaxID=2795564 RepID=UPI001568AB15|nr:tRNA pseudouridine(38/39) synthase [Maniola hyperantus]
MEKVPPKQKKIKGLKREDLLNMDKNDLVDKLIQLEAHNEQLKNIISKNLENNSDIQTGAGKRKFDFSKCHYRRLLLRILYFGWNYQGLAVQEDSTQTIEHHLFHALKKSCLIESREKSQYHRCGRTDKGVSAFGQVISITLRSKHVPSEQNLPSSISSEMPYCKILNRLLPKEIRAVAWMPIPDEKPEFSARFDCKKRQYKYYFPKSSLDINAMRDACRHLIGSHDFRHLCKMDVGNNVTEFRREILKADIEALDQNDCNSATSMYTLTIEGNAFLWHQIRCIMGVLLLVGQGRELPSIITDLLDVQTNPRKPQYNMALDVPLNLFHCSYDIEERWVYDQDELRNVIVHLQSEWTVHSVKTTMIKDCLSNLEEIFDSLSKEKETGDGLENASDRDRVMAHADCLLQGVKPRNYTPLLKRETCSSLEERIEYYRKKRKMAVVE